MTIDKDEIRKSLDYFEDDKFTNSKDILSKEIARAKTDFLRGKLELDKWGKEEE